MPSLKNLSIILLTIFFLLILGLIIFELLFSNLIFESEWRKANYINIIRDYKSTSKVRDQNNTEYLITYTRDKYGLRGSCEYNGKVDILFMGGSTTDQRYISDDKTFQEFLQNKLSLKLDKEICIFNAGVDGHSTFGHVSSFDNWFNLIPKFKPKIFILYVGINDAAFRDSRTFEDLNNNQKLGLFEIIKFNSVTFKTLKRIKYIIDSLISKNIYGDHLILWPKDIYKYTEKINTKNVDELIKINTEDFGLRFELLLNKINKYGSTIVCVTQPHFISRKINNEEVGIDIAFQYRGKNYNGLDYKKSLNSINSEMKRQCQKNNIFFIDIDRNDFDFMQDFYDPVHMLPSGNDKLANILYKKIIDFEIIK